MLTIIDPSLKKIEEKVRNNKRLSFEDGLALFASPDLLGVGSLSNIVRNRKNNDTAYFICNRHINYTNICKNQCTFCAFGKKKEDQSSYVMSIKEILQAASTDEKIKEFHIVGGLHPELPFDYYLDLLSTIHTHYPDTHIQAFTAVEIDYLAKIADLSLKETFLKLKEAGLGSLPGGGAEIFNPSIRSQICPDKISGDRWLEVMETAHDLGFKSNATMLYGHLEKDEDRIDHLIKLRDLQDRTNGFMSFIPLAFHPQNTQMNSFPSTTAYQDLQILAISRLMLDNFPHIKSFWIMIGLKLAQISLSFGVDDIDGTVVEEKITHSAGAQTAESVEKDELIRLIKNAHRIPVERDTLYNIVQQY